MSQPTSRPAPPLLVTQHYWPELIGSGPYCDDLADWLCQTAGRAVVFTCRPHYPESAVPVAYRNGDRDRETRGRCKVIRVNPWLTKRRGAKERLFTETGFLISGLIALVFGRIRRADLVVSLCPSIFTVLLGEIATRRRGTHVAVVHDIQSGLASRLGMVSSGVVVTMMRWLERVVLNRTDAILVLSDDMKRCLQEQGIDRPIDVLPLWVDVGSDPSPCRDECESVTVVYGGNLGKKQGLGQVIDMAAILKQRGGDISIVLRGEGTEKDALARQITDLGLDNIRFQPLVPPEELADSLAEGDIHLVPQRDGIADYAVPSKVFAVMAAERPFVATAASNSLLWRLMEESRGFLCVPTGDALALADAVMHLAQNPARRRELGSNGRRYVVANHERTLVRRKFHAILRRGRKSHWNDERQAATPSRF